MRVDVDTQGAGTESALGAVTGPVIQIRTRSRPGGVEGAERKYSVTPGRFPHLRLSDQTGAFSIEYIATMLSQLGKYFLYGGKQLTPKHVGAVCQAAQLTNRVLGTFISLLLEATFSKHHAFARVPLA